MLTGRPIGRLAGGLAIIGFWFIIIIIMGFMPGIIPGIAPGMVGIPIIMGFMPGIIPGIAGIPIMPPMPPEAWDAG